MTSDYLIQRGETWYYYRRIPQHYKQVDSRKFIRESLKTDSRAEALVRAQAVNRAAEQLWADRIEGKAQSADLRYDNAVRLARRFGIPYMPVEDVAALPLRDLMTRVRLMEGRDDPAALDTVFGGAAQPELLMSEALDKYIELERDKLKGKNDNQIRKWKNPRKKAVTNFIRVVGDKPLSSLDRAEALVFRDWWMNRLMEDGLSANSANKDLGYIKQIYNTLRDRMQLRIRADVFAGLSFSEDSSSNRIPFPRDHVQQYLVDGRNLDGLNDECRALIWVMASTGARLSEVCGLLPEDIHLDADVPFVQIRPNAIRTLKTSDSERDMPLCGTALEAMKAFPEGFSHYQTRTDRASDTINKYLWEKGLRPDERMTLYSLRHTFQDALTAIRSIDRMQADLMGHKFDRPRYGQGPTLLQKQQEVARCAFYPSV